MTNTLYTPFKNCGWKNPDDGTCSHPHNATPECHQHICPIHVSENVTKPLTIYSHGDVTSYEVREITSLPKQGNRQPLKGIERVPLYVVEESKS